jgi:hypothetical protein
MSEDYKVTAYGLEFRVPSELIDDGLDKIYHDMMIERLRLSNLRMEIEMGAGLSPSDAKFLLAQLDWAQKRLAEKPPPALLDSARRWLANKIRPAQEDDEY